MTAQSSPQHIWHSPTVRNLFAICTLSGILASFTVLTAAYAAVPSTARSIRSTRLAQSTYYFAGNDHDNRPIVIDINSIALTNQPNQVDFDYLADGTRLSSTADCTGTGNWTTHHDQQQHRPQSDATDTMLQLVCSYLPGYALADAVPPESQTTTPVETPLETHADSQVEPETEAAPTLQALVYDPVSNVRATPNGTIICEIATRSYINIYEDIDGWYQTDACDRPGFIHYSQIAF